MNIFFRLINLCICSCYFNLSIIFFTSLLLTNYFFQSWPFLNLDKQVWRCERSLFRFNSLPLTCNLFERRFASLSNESFTLDHEGRLLNVHLTNDYWDILIASTMISFWSHTTLLFLWRGLAFKIIPIKNLRMFLFLWLKDLIGNRLV